MVVDIAQSEFGYSEYSRCSSTLKGASSHISVGCLLGEVFWASPIGRRLRRRLRRDYISWVVWKCLGVSQDELEEAVWTFLFRFPPQSAENG